MLASTFGDLETVKSLISEVAEKSELVTLKVSDVDLIADFDQAKKLSLVGRVHLENLLTDILGAKADLSDRRILRPEVLERAQRESIVVF